jgi:5-methylcytosine-specific restriction protein A
MDYPALSHSWFLLSETIAVKRLDKSAFLHHGTGIPKEIVTHFTPDGTVPDDGTPITLVHSGTQYSAHLQYDAVKKRVRLFWAADLEAVIQQTFPAVHQKHLNDLDVEQPPLMKLTTTAPLSFQIEFSETHETSGDWTDLELEASVLAYFQMLNKEQKGVAYNKSETNRQLREVILSSRSKGSVEFRMANISAVLEDLCHPIIKGYRSRDNVGAEVSARIKKAIYAHDLLTPLDYSPTADDTELDKKVTSLLKKGVQGKPKGQKTPKKTAKTGSGFERDPLVKSWVLQNANGICELCSSAAPFVDAHGKGFLEVHHVQFLANDGEDTIENAVALCPNCHRKAHYAAEPQIVTEDIKKLVTRIV